MADRKDCSHVSTAFGLTQAARELHMHAEMELRLGVEWEHVRDAFVSSGRMIVAHAPQTRVSVRRKPVLTGCLAFSEGVHPDTKESMWLEHFLYVRPEYRGGNTAQALLAFWEYRAKQHGIQKLCAGSSLGNNALAKRLYTGAGFTTNLTFARTSPNVRPNHSNRRCGYGLRRPDRR